MYFVRLLNKMSQVVVCISHLFRRDVHIVSINEHHAWEEGRIECVYSKGERNIIWVFYNISPTKLNRTVISVS